jgi:RNA polymerase sigma factor for flagellar operon FliA
MYERQKFATRPGTPDPATHDSGRCNDHDARCENDVVKTPGTNECAPVLRPGRPSGRQRQEREPTLAGNTGNARCENRVVKTRAPKDAPDDTRNQRVEAHLDLVPSIARTYRCHARGHGIELEDLVAYGRRGLLDAAWRFDPTNGAPFRAFARPRIHGAIIDGIRREGWFGRRAYRPGSAHGSSVVDRAANDPRSVATPPSGLTIIYAEQRTRAGGEDWIGDVAPPAEGGHVAGWNGRRMVQVPVDGGPPLQALATYLPLLPARERRRIDLCYYQEKTLSQAAGEMGFRRSWASRLHARALTRLRAAMQVPSPTARTSAIGNDQWPASRRSRSEAR